LTILVTRQDAALTQEQRQNRLDVGEKVVRRIGNGLKDLDWRGVPRYTATDAATRLSSVPPPPPAI
jgi:hypothetical protein